MIGPTINLYSYLKSHSIISCEHNPHNITGALKNFSLEKSRRGGTDSQDGE